MKRIAVLLSLMLIVLTASVASATSVIKHPKISWVATSRYYDSEHGFMVSMVRSQITLSSATASNSVTVRIFDYEGSSLDWFWEFETFPPGGLNAGQTAQWEKFLEYTEAVGKCDDFSPEATAYNSTTTHQTSKVSIYQYADHMDVLRDMSGCGLRHGDAPPNPPNSGS